MRLATILVAALLLCGCPPLHAMLPAISAVGAGAQWLGSVIDMADAGQDAYFDRHPSLEREQAVDAALLRARFAVEALDAAVAAAKSVDDSSVQAAKDEALASYDALRSLLEEFGVTGALPPLGGAETDAPDPQPFSLPTRTEVAARL